MTATIEPTVDQKVEIVASFLQVGGNTEGFNKTAFAKQFNISPRTLGRYVEKYSDQANKLIAQAEQKNTEKTRRGFKGRNGRMEFIRELFADMGLTAKTKVLFAEANRRAVEQGLPPVERASFYAILCTARKNAGINIKELKKQAV